MSKTNSTLKGSHKNRPPEAHGEDLIAMGRYDLDAKINRAEVAFVVRDDWQNRDIGTFVLQHLIKIARRNGIAGFTAEVLRFNRPMQTVFGKGNVFSHRNLFRTREIGHGVRKRQERRHAESR